ncbi:GntR family transcriptional regulator [Methylobacterium sp. Leaf466]|uniref:GntR family transcriptional regulator n=1 Tax=Methylobacterium sp. Leaf466 TaxID=1736386 RepID=UPI0006FA0094|nr:GntR family transcriptional regulator [Methylobacterium sp. Leaf466]KQT84400.1 GntR family transcriptional regulator [Methylobacterium sp. Leaf466]
MTRTESAPGINRRYLHDEVVERMRDLIVSGQLPPRSRVNEGELTERFGISRTPLREAIKILATEGLLELLPNRGARVASLALSEIEEMIEVIAGLEATAAEIACTIIGDDEVAAIEADHAAMMAAWKRGDQRKYFVYNRAIHEGLMSASRNATLNHIYAGLSGRIQHSRYSVHQTAAEWAQAVDEHDRMIALLRARDGSALSTLMRAHVRARKAVIVANFVEPAEGMTPA